MLDDSWDPFGPRFRALVEGFAIFNPHATISLDWFGEKTTWRATDAQWVKWKPYQPTSSHWYELPHLERLIGAYITHDRENGGDRLMSDLIAEFDGLSGSLKQARVLEESGLKRVKLSEFVVDGHLDSNRIAKLLAAMQRHTRPVKSERLGIIGEDHLRTRLLAMGIKPESFRYSNKLGKCKNSQTDQDEKASSLPWVLESAFGWLGQESNDHRLFEESKTRRRIFSGANWSAAIKNPFRSFGNTGEGLETVLSDMRATRSEPVVFVLHLAHPRVEYTDRGKSSLIVEGGCDMTITAADILAVTKTVTKEWTKQRKAEERGSRSRDSREYMYSDRVNFTDIAEDILPKGYAHASGNGQYTVDKRQFYYAVRDEFQEQTGREIDADYFSQTLLVKYMNQHSEETADWKITASPRGTLSIPNAGHDLRIPCGTTAIEEHLAEAGETCDPFDIDAELRIEWPSVAEGQRYQAVLYIEKEGFDPQLREAKIGKRFDVAIISCKGQSVTAARMFADHVCRINGGVPLLVATDFDKYGFSICQRLTTVSDHARDNDLVKYEFQNDINVTHLGLRLVDVRKYGLKSEKHPFKGDFPADTIATEEEQDFLKSGRRVELNAFPAPQFIEWIETKLTQHLPKRLIPADDILADAYRRALATAKINRAIEDVKGEAIENAKTAEIPKSLRRQLQRELKNSPHAWDKVLYDIAEKSLLSREGKK